MRSSRWAKGCFFFRWLTCIDLPIMSSVFEMGHNVNRGGTEQAMRGMDGGAVRGVP